MPRVRITKPFRLTRNDGTQMDFSPAGTNLEEDDAEPGVYEVSDEDAKHWFLQHHTNKPPKTEAPVNSQDAIAASAAAQTRLRTQEAVQRNQEQEAMNEVRAKRIPGAPVTTPAAVDPIGVPAPNSKNPMPKASPPGDTEKVPVNPGKSPIDHDAPRPKG